MVIEKATYFYDEMKITDRCTFSNGWLQSNKKKILGINLSSIDTVTYYGTFDIPTAV